MSPRIVGLAATTALAFGAALLLTSPVFTQTARADESFVVPAPAQDITPGISNRAEIVLSGGCFWGVQGVFQHVAGVTQAVSGYAGGAAKTADYETVSTGSTGHAESVDIIFDPHKISTGQILRIFFSVAHDPTKINAQGPDRGTQYRSAIFATTDDQLRVARAYVAQLNAAHVFAAPIATEVTRLPAFYAAETYHQNYLTLNPGQPYIAINDLPKVAALKSLFAQNYREEPALVADSLAK